jgi:NAD(P)-dependent dehydrogenase (short-subunit alcohol dehydrogenase family)
MSGLLKGNVALITGAASGIGRATALTLARDGAAIVVADIDESGALATVAAITAAGGRAIFVQANVTRDAERMVDAAVQGFGRLDILVNNAGIFYTADLLNVTFDAWVRVVDIMYFGTFRCSQAAARQMVRQGNGGRIVNISSVNGFLGMPQSSHYNSAKGAIDQLTRCLAVELAPHGILVNGVAPGFVETPMAIVNGVNEHETPEFQEFYVRRRRIPLARPAMPEEIAEAVAFLVSPRCTYITGHTLVADGGLSITF